MRSGLEWWKGMGKGLWRLGLGVEGQWVEGIVDGRVG